MQPEKIGIYEVKSELGRGGMATVYWAYDPRFEREVAVKVLPRELLHSDPQFRLRFEREAKIIAQLEHSAIVPVYDVGESDGQPYFVMRYMNGGSLSERIKEGGLSVEDAARILETIAPGLDEAHSKGIVHRDIKPSNILFDKRGNPYISDFGIAKLSNAQAGNVTGSAIIGTPAYMAPEQAQGTEVDGRADVYSLGIILFEMLTGRQPYEADTPMAVAIKHITDPIPQILQARPQLPDGMETIIQKAMAKDRNERFSTAVEMAQALREVARGEPTKIQAKVAPTFRASRNAVGQKKAFNAVFVIIPGILVVLLAAAAGGLFLFNGTRSPAASDAPTHTVTVTLTPAFTATSVPAVDSTEFPGVILEPTGTATLPPAPTDTAIPSLPLLGGADKIAFVANNEIRLMNVDGSDFNPLTSDGAAKNDLQWLDADTLLFISGKNIKFYRLSTGAVDTLTSFPSAVSVDAFQVSHDGKQVMIAMSNEIFVVPFDMQTMKSIHTRGDLFAIPNTCILPVGKTRSALKVREARWSADDKLVAWLFKGVDAGNASLETEQVSVFNIQACKAGSIDLLDNFPGTRFNPPSFQNRLMPDFDWDGFDQFIFNTSKRNNGWGELHIYNWDSHKPNLSVNPIDQKCCYRDARWSPDGTYLFFAFQDEGLADHATTALYYVSAGELNTGAHFTPIKLPDDFSFKNPKEAPQPALRPAQE